MYIDAPSTAPLARPDAAPSAFDPAAPADVRAAVALPPYGGRVELVRADAFGPIDGLNAIACVPVRNEAALLPGTLDALGAAMAAVPGAGVVVVVNNTDDASAEIVRRWAATTAVPVLCWDVRLVPPADTVAFARRLAFDIGAAVAAPGAALLSTDADTVVPADWAVRMVGLVRGGADLVVGGIGVDADEVAALPPAVHHAGAVEGELGATYHAIWTRLVADVPCPMLIAAGGANMAVSVDAYRAVGGLPTDQRNEDRALTEAILAAGLPIAVDRAVVVTTSLRTEARARHGMADAIAERCRDADPHVDGLLVPLSTFVGRVVAHLEGTGRLARGGRPALRVSEAATEVAAAQVLLRRLEAVSPDDRLAVARAALDA